MKIKVNGDERTIDEGTTIAALIEELKIPAAGTAVAIGDAIVPRSEYALRTLNEGECIEVIRAIGGG